MIFAQHKIHNFCPAHHHILEVYFAFWIKVCLYVRMYVWEEGRSCTTTWFIVTTRNRKINLTDVSRIFLCQILKVAPKWLNLYNENWLFRIKRIFSLRAYPISFHFKSMKFSAMLSSIENILYLKILIEYMHRRTHPLDYSIWYI